MKSTKYEHKVFSVSVKNSRGVEVVEYQGVPAKNAGEAIQRVRDDLKFTAEAEAQ